MRKLTITLLSLFLLSSISCSDFLNREPISQINSDDYFSTINEALGGINGCYNELQDIVRNELVRITTGSDEFTTPALNGNDPFIQRNLTSSEAAFQTMWPRGFKLIQLANLGLEKIPNITENKDQGIGIIRPSLLSELKVLRALTYFYYVQLWGPVPIYDRPVSDLITDPAILVKPRSPIEDVYNFIERDIREAIPNLPVSRTSAVDTRGRITKAAAQVLLSKVLLTRPGSGSAEAQEAVTRLDSVLNNAQYQLVTQANFISMFRVNGKNGTESIFELQFELQDASDLKRLFLPTGRNPDDRHGNYNVAPSPKIIGLYESSDVRRGLIGTVPATGSIFIIPAGSRYVTKHIREGGANNAGGTDTNFIIFRLADAILLKAEALDKITPENPAAVVELNRIRTRAGATLYPSAADAGIPLKEVIQTERLKELAFENHRWFDLNRTGLATSVLGIQACRTLMPVPIQEIRLNPNLNPQNECY